MVKNSMYTHICTLLINSKSLRSTQLNAMGSSYIGKPVQWRSTALTLVAFALAFLFATATCYESVVSCSFKTERTLHMGAIGANKSVNTVDLDELCIWIYGIYEETLAQANNQGELGNVISKI